VRQRGWRFPLVLRANPAIPRPFLLHDILPSSTSEHTISAILSPATMFSHAALNATLNGTSAVLLAAGYTAIRSGKRKVHKALMISAVIASCTFLVSYVVYHLRVHQVILFRGQGWIRPVYFAILTSHTLLAMVIVPLIIMTLRRAWLGRFDTHRLIARWTLPLWFYVSVTGVIVYFMVYQVYAPH
jgi:uncharacterized membrane protein YozB (DUF420 family)